MADYEILIKPSAAREYDRLPASVASRVAKKIESLAAEPRPRGVKKLEGGPARWRLRAGDWRIVYSIDDTQRVVDILLHSPPKQSLRLESSVGELRDDGSHFTILPLGDLIRRCPPSQQTAWREQPQSGLVATVELEQLPENELESQQSV